MLLPGLWEEGAISRLAVVDSGLGAGPGICLYYARYAMPGTDLACAAARQSQYLVCDWRRLSRVSYQPTCARCAMPGTDLAYAAITRRACCAMAGTDLANGLPRSYEVCEVPWNEVYASQLHACYAMPSTDIAAGVFRWMWRESSR
eukprot:372280-Rhodomonas_salina.2